MTRRAALAAIAAVGACTLAACDDGVPDIDTTDAARSAAGWTATGTLDRCPLGDIAALLDDATADVDDPVVIDALGGNELVGIDRPTGVDDPILTCSLATGEVYAGVAVTAAPDDLDAYVRSLADPSGGRGAVVEVRRTNPYRGGEFHRVCAVFPGEPDDTWCEVDWLDDRLLVGLFIGGDGADDVDLRPIEERFGYLIEPMLQRLTATSTDTETDAETDAES